MGEAGSRNAARATGPWLAGSAALAGLWAAMLLLGAGAADRALLLALYAGDQPWISLVGIGLTKLGNGSTLIAATLLATLWLLHRRRQWDALMLLALTFAGRALIILQKLWFARLRPEEEMRLVEVSSLSFPSGHAGNSMIVYLSLALLLFEDPRRQRIAAICAVVLSLLIGVSRSVVGVHWPSDVVGGWAFGLLWVMLGFRLAQTLKRNRSTSPSCTT